MCVAGAVHGIRCYRCGQYNEGVGSITPCINYTAQMLMECSATDEWCIVSTYYYYLLIFFSFEPSFKLPNDERRVNHLRTSAEKLLPRNKCEKYMPCMVKDFSRTRPEMRGRGSSRASRKKINISFASMRRQGSLDTLPKSAITNDVIYLSLMLDL